MARYQIWDRVSDVITPSGEIFTAGQWKQKYPVATRLDIVLAGGDVNGAFFAVYSQFVQMYAEMGCDYTDCVDQQDYLDAIEAFQDAMNAGDGESTPEERIAAALELQNLLSMEPVNLDDPDAE